MAKYGFSNLIISMPYPGLFACMNVGHSMSNYPAVSCVGGGLVYILDVVHRPMCECQLNVCCELTHSNFTLACKLK